MKKIYSLLAIAGITMSMTATEQMSKGIAPLRAALETNTFTLESVKLPAVDNIKKAPQSRVAISSISECTGIYDYNVVIPTQTGDKSAVFTGEITHLSGNNVMISGVRYVDVEFKGTVDLAAGTITCPSQELLDLGRDQLYMYKAVEEPEGLYLTEEDLVFTMNADKSMTLPDNEYIIYAYKSNPTETVMAMLGKVKFTVSTKNVKAVVEERDVNSNNQYIDTYTKYNQYFNATFDGNNNRIALEGFMFNNAMAQGMDASPIYITINPTAKTAEIASNQHWFTLTQGTQSASTTFFCFDPETQNILPSYPCTVNGNKLSWSGDFVCVDEQGGFWGWYRNCDMTLPFDVFTGAEGGIENVTATTDVNAPVEYFNLQGVRVANPEAGQLVIKRQGSTVTKIVVR